MGSKKLFGIFCALVGVVWYSKIQLDKQTQAKAAVQSAPPLPESEKRKEDTA